MEVDNFNNNKIIVTIIFNKVKIVSNRVIKIIIIIQVEILKPLNLKIKK